MTEQAIQAMMSAWNKAEMEWREAKAVVFSEMRLVANNEKIAIAEKQTDDVVSSAWICTDQPVEVRQ